MAKKRTLRRSPRRKLATSRNPELKFKRRERKFLIELTKILDRRLSQSSDLDVYRAIDRISKKILLNKKGLILKILKSI